MIRFLILLASLFCLLIALLVAVGTFNGNYQAWLAGGLFAFVLSHALAWPPTPAPPAQ